MFARYLVIAVGATNDLMHPSFISVIGTTWSSKNAHVLARRNSVPAMVMKLTPSVRASLMQFGTPFGQ